jgi:hypothetical protein
VVPRRSRSTSASIVPLRLAKKKKKGALLFSPRAGARLIAGAVRRLTETSRLGPTHVHFHFHSTPTPSAGLKTACTSKHQLAMTGRWRLGTSANPISVRLTNTSVRPTQIPAVPFHQLLLSLHIPVFNRASAGHASALLSVGATSPHSIDAAAGNDPHRTPTSPSCWPPPEPDTLRRRG